MPGVEVVFYREDDAAGAAIPALDWLIELSRTNIKAYVKCRQRLELLRAKGHELKRPYADILRDGIYELRVRMGTVNYRLLFFFQGRIAAVIACGLIKEAMVPSVEIDRAIERKKKLMRNPARHSFREL